MPLYQNFTESTPPKTGLLNQDIAVQTIFNFIETNLPNFKINFEEINSKNKEGHYNKQLEDYFQRIARKQSAIFFFRGNSPNQKDSFPDLSSLMVEDDKHNSFFDIECKRLYDKNKKEYVAGKTGGIERFKKNLHGTDLEYSAMIGYVENRDENFWLERINGWIEFEFQKKRSFWSKKDKLQKIESRVISRHRKAGAEPDSIELCHFFLIV